MTRSDDRRQRMPRLLLPGVSRRRLLTWAAIGSGILVAPTRAMAGAPETSTRTTWAFTQGSTNGDDAYVGPQYRHSVDWDPDVWNYSSSAESGFDYAYDYVNLSSATIYGSAQVTHDELPLVDLAEAEEKSFDLYIAGLGQTRNDAELLGEWASDEAAGTLFYWLGYDDVPYTYIEYAPTEEEGIWSVSYIQLMASGWDLADAAALYKGIWVDDAPMIRATGVGDILAAILADVEQGG